jgi:glutamate-ammonia-ligase adenylyltransferase
MALDAKTGPGRLMDIELLAETGALLTGSPERSVAAQLEAAGKAFKLSIEDKALLADAAQLFWRVQAAARLMAGEGSVERDSVGAAAGSFLLRETGAETVEALERQLSEVAEGVAALIERHIGTSRRKP